MLHRGLALHSLKTALESYGGQHSACIDLYAMSKFYDIFIHSTPIPASGDSHLYRMQGPAGTCPSTVENRDFLTQRATLLMV